MELTIDNAQVRVINISAFGVGIENNNYSEGETHNASFTLPGRNARISTTLTIIYIDPNNCCHCEFNVISKDEAEAIHQYVFERQMEELRNKSTA